MYQIWERSWIVEALCITWIALTQVMQTRDPPLHRFGGRLRLLSTCTRRGWIQPHLQCARILNY